MRRLRPRASRTTRCPPLHGEVAPPATPPPPSTGTRAGRASRCTWECQLVTQRLAKAVHSCADAVFELDDGVLGPERVADLVACHDLTRTLKEDDEDDEGLLGQPDDDVLGSVEFAREHVEFKTVEPGEDRTPLGRRHDAYPACDGMVARLLLCRCPPWSSNSSWIPHPTNDLAPVT